ncbi:glycosyltransferase family protein [Anaeromyxobacter paludicola]|uniref:Spore protein YkvP/CgeB glycosyl transferase-like domain-containing protein n=1 Tax=Anaeromyxobacter paludicola TaxID=2918171 RepID=A0ABN6N652_9BACT|nr:glycosyltransferase [Anaeromyxobacter paludicola]BDG08020.1 hypothetical protein AMPC_11330 [Anaeromyxobacter paludicola]
MTLEKNLLALAERDPELVVRLSWPAGSDHVVEGAEGPEYVLGMQRFPLRVGPEAAAGLARQAGDEAFLFGLGLGELAAALLAGGRLVVAWERDPWLMRLALSRHDLSGALRAGTLRLLLGSDLVEERRRGLRGGLVLHPLLGQVYGVERRLLEGRHDRPVAALASGGLFVQDLAAGLERAGLAPFTLDLGRLSREELSRSLGRLRPALLAAVNYVDGLAEFCAAHGVTLVCWEIDPATSDLQPCGEPGRSFIFTYRRGAVAEYRAAGFPHVEHLPLAADPARRRPVDVSGPESARHRAAVSVVGSSMVPDVARHERAFLEAWEAAHGPGARGTGLAALSWVLEAQSRDLSAHRVPALLAGRWPALAAAHPEAVRAASEIAAALKRLAAVRRLARFAPRVWGDEGWREAEGGGVAYMGPAGHGDELDRIYCGSAVNVDLGRLYQMDIVTMRVFDVLACGGFVLAERSDDLAALFEVGVEVDCYGSLEELERKVAHYLAHPDRAAALAARGREAVLGRHTVQSRVDHMLAVAGCAPPG